MKESTPSSPSSIAGVSFAMTRRKHPKRTSTMPSLCFATMRTFPASQHFRAAPHLKWLQAQAPERLQVVRPPLQAMPGLLCLSLFHSRPACTNGHTRLTKRRVVIAGRARDTIVRIGSKRSLCSRLKLIMILRVGQRIHRCARSASPDNQHNSTNNNSKS